MDTPNKLRLRGHLHHQQDHQYAHSNASTASPLSSSSASPLKSNSQHPSYLPLTSNLPPTIYAWSGKGHYHDRDADSGNNKGSRHGRVRRRKLHGFHRVCRNIQLRIQTRTGLLFMRFMVLVSMYVLSQWILQGIDYIQDLYHDFQHQQQLNNKDPMSYFQPRYTIPLQDIPRKNWPVITRTLFRPHNSHLLREAKNAITELGREIRALLGSSSILSLQQPAGIAKNKYLTPWEMSPQERDKWNNDKNSPDALLFRQRLAANAKWLRGDFQHDPHWPLSMLPDLVPGRALVISGGDKQLLYLKALVHTVRVIHQSTIPIRIVYRDSLDLTEPSKRDIRQQAQINNGNKNNDTNNNDNIQFIDLSTYFDLDAANIEGWNLKAFGVLAVPETQVAVLDADVLLLRPPEDLFQARGYQRTGALFFHDRVKPQFYWDVHVFVKWLQPSFSISRSARAQRLLVYGNTNGGSIFGGSTAYTEQVQEAGVMLIDKTRRARGIWAACLIFGRDDIRKYIQNDHMYGDKEVYWSVMEALADNDQPADYVVNNNNYEFARFYPGVIGGTVTDFAGRTTHLPLDATPEQIQAEFAISRAGNDALCGRLLHFDDDGVPLWANGGYMLKEDDWFSSAAISQSAINPVWFIDGGDAQTENFPNPWLPWWRNMLQWYGTLLGQNQVWALHRAMGVECLSPNSRQLRTVPMKMANTARRAVQYYFEQRVKKASIARDTNMTSTS